MNESLMLQLYGSNVIQSLSMMVVCASGGKWLFPRGKSRDEMKDEKKIYQHILGKM